MGALNHNQNLYRTRPWELNKNISFDIFSIETPLLKVETIRNVDIVRVSPLMIEGYRFLLNDITRYSYMFFNYKSSNNINLKINNLLNININWIKLINFLQYISIICINNTNLILLNNLDKKLKSKFLLYKKNINNFFYIFLSDTIDLLNLKKSLSFTTEIFGYNAICFIQDVPIFLINKLDKSCLKKEVSKFTNFVNLELNISKIINFYMNNSINIIKPINYINILNKFNFNYIYFYLFFNFVFKFFINTNLDFNKIELNKLENFLGLFYYLNNKIISKKSKLNFLGNFNNLNKLNLNKVLTNKYGIFFFNTNTDFNLNFLGYKKKIININKNFIFKDFLCLIDISSFINWESFLFNNLLKLKVFNFNFIVSRDKLTGLNIPVNSILTIKNLLFFNVYGNVVNSTRIINTKPLTKSINLILETLKKHI